MDQQESIDLKPPKGTRDFYPDDMRLRKWMFGEFAAVSELFGFEQYDSPVLESEALFVRKAGEEIRDQLFNFNDKGDRAVALRPELTPSLSRMFLAKAGTLPQPVKWYGIGQCWRYERMTRGRRREHYQWNMDIIGVAEVTAEAELLSAITTFFTVLPRWLTAAGSPLRNLIASPQSEPSKLTRSAVCPNRLTTAAWSPSQGATAASIAVAKLRQCSSKVRSTPQHITR